MRDHFLVYGSKARTPHCGPQLSPLLLGCPVALLLRSPLLGRSGPADTAPDRPPAARLLDTCKSSSFNFVLL